MEKTLRKRIEKIKNPDVADDFILVDAKDPDATFGISATGYRDKSDPSQGYRSLTEFHGEIVELVRQNILDVVLTTIFSVECLTAEKDIFQESTITPAVRINSSTELWLARGGRYSAQPSLPYSHVSLERVIYGTDHRQPKKAQLNLGLYSITFTNDIAADLVSMNALREFYQQAADLNFDYLLEVFPPNIEDCGISPEDIPAFCNDQIARLISLTPRAAQPLFLKIPYFGPEAMLELTNYHPDTIIGILGGSSGTTLDAFTLISEAQKYGARAAIFGRRIKNSEDPLLFVELLREIVSSDLSPKQAVEKYHHELKNNQIKSIRSFADDCQLVNPALNYLK
ncbi:MAG: hypothetical protein MUP53_07475 [Bacteroidales bacterium]|nr:hypothetical protein [Bacteroidales bacterium]